MAQPQPFIPAFAHALSSFSLQSANSDPLFLSGLFHALSEQSYPDQELQSRMTDAMYRHNSSAMLGALHSILYLHKQKVFASGTMSNFIGLCNALVQHYELHDRIAKTRTISCAALYYHVLIEALCEDPYLFESLMTEDFTAPDRAKATRAAPSGLKQQVFCFWAHFRSHATDESYESQLICEASARMISSFCLFGGFAACKASADAARSDLKNDLHVVLKLIEAMTAVPGGLSLFLWTLMGRIFLVFDSQLTDPEDVWTAKRLAKFNKATFALGEDERVALFYYSFLKCISLARSSNLWDNERERAAILDVGRKFTEFYDEAFLGCSLANPEHQRLLHILLSEES
jgi:hypothetical protein